MIVGETGMGVGVRMGINGQQGRMERRTHSERGVPSSANWNPTKPFIKRQQYADAMRPV